MFFSIEYMRFGNYKPTLELLQSFSRIKLKTKMKKYILMMLLTASSTLMLFGQPLTVKGKIVNASNNMPIEAVSIHIKNTSKFTSSNRDGTFVLDARINDILVCNHVSFKTKEIVVDGSNLLITLEEKIINLDHIIVKGQCFARYIAIYRSGR